MPDGSRITHLRALVARLQRSPASRERDALLREAGKRVVMIETGVPESRAADDGHAPGEAEMATRRMAKSLRD
jgi:hypothetical protein